MTLSAIHHFPAAGCRPSELALYSPRTSIVVRRDADQLRPRVVVAAVDNESMNGANPANCDNAGLNANVHSIGTIRHTAESFADGLKSASTQIILCPAKAEFGNREGWAKTTLEATTATIEMKDITRR